MSRIRRILRILRLLRDSRGIELVCPSHIVCIYIGGGLAVWLLVKSVSFDPPLLHLHLQRERERERERDKRMDKREKGRKRTYR
jgi:hypothetical protein